MINKESSDGEFTGILSEMCNMLSSGLFYTHTRINNNTKKNLEAASFLYALIELLNEKGLLTIEELDERGTSAVSDQDEFYMYLWLFLSRNSEKQHCSQPKSRSIASYWQQKRCWSETADAPDERKKLVAERLVKKFTESGIGLMYQDPEYDKYTFEHVAIVSCQSRLHICKAVCCKFPFALSRQDVDEEIIRWEFGKPYLIAHDEDGYCVHLERNSCQCTVHENRPVPCRGFDCQNNEKWRVWLDYEKKITNPELVEQINQGSRKFYAYSKPKSISNGGENSK